jgi:hypothetical protein
MTHGTPADWLSERVMEKPSYSEVMRKTDAFS